MAEAVDLVLNGKVVFGREVPSVDVRILEPIAGFELKLERSDQDLANRVGERDVHLRDRQRQHVGRVAAPLLAAPHT